MLTIQPVRSHQIAAVQQLIATVVYEVWQLPASEIPMYDDMANLADIQTHYLENGGIFLVLVEGDRVVGCGALRLYSPKIGELKRIWLLPEYRRQGWATQLAIELLNFAKNAGYEKGRC
jgi:putative acetyltransferase